MSILRRFLPALLAITSFAPTCGRAQTAKTKLNEQIWEGKLSVRPGVELRLVMHATPKAGGGFVGTLDSPDQGASGLELSAIVLDKSKLAFELKVAGARFEGKMNAATTEAEGSWSQGGSTLPLKLVKTDKLAAQPAVVGHEQIWEGKLPVGAGLEYRLVLHLGKTASNEWLGRLDSLDEGLKGLKLSAISLDQARMAFELKFSNAKYEGKLNANGNEASGTWSQRGVSIPLTFMKTDKVSEIRRPQTPRSPFPYKTEDVTYQNQAAGVTFAGTLTKPGGAGPFPVVILISGSGPQDRDETIFQHKPFLVLADSLTRRGVAVLRVDDRGVGGSSGKISEATTEDFAGDVLAGIAFLKSRSDIDTHKIGLIGHSEGGLIAPLVAARAPDVAFIVLLAGTGLPGDEILYRQGQLVMKAMGADAKALERQRETQKRLLEIVKSEKDQAKATAQLREAVKKLISELPEAERKAAGDGEALLSAQVEQVNSPWFRYFLTFDPRTALAKVRCPVLALNGSKDTQVPAKENLTEIENALKKAGNNQVTIRELPGLNHLFQTCKTGAPGEYAVIEETIAPSALDAVGEWVDRQVK
jgi:uncharacterized protein